jgi:hypothetical protein
VNVRTVSSLPGKGVEFVSPDVMERAAADWGSGGLYLQGTNWRLKSTGRIAPYNRELKARGVTWEQLHRETEKRRVDVLFRVGRSSIEMMNYSDDNAVIALFPGLAGTADPYTCTAYVHVGQHTSADPHHVVNSTRPATAEEYADLKRELEQRGYVLRMVHRLSSRYLAERRAQLA